MSYFNNLSFRQQFTGLAFLSGILSLITEFEGVFMLLIILGAGLIYGLITLKVILAKYPKRSTKYIWLIFCTISYLIAFFISAQDSSGEFSRLENHSLFIGGLIGALILTVGFKMVIKQNNETIPLFNIILILLVGGLIPSAIYNLILNNDYYAMVLIYTIWPIVISFMLASSIKKTV